MKTQQSLSKAAKPTKLDRLQISLAKKEALENKLFDRLFEMIRETNGQPMNDKKDGPAYFKKRAKIDDAIRHIQAGIELTKNAIEKENAARFRVSSVALPGFLAEMVENGTLIQWRKHPTMFFVKGVDKARIIYDPKSGNVLHKFSSSIPNQEQYDIFKNVVAEIRQKFTR